VEVWEGGCGRRGWLRASVGGGTLRTGVRTTFAARRGG
jgi:hypothetical protein